MIPAGWAVLWQEPPVWLKDLGNFSPSRLLAMSVGLIALVVVTKYLRRWLVDRLLLRLGVERGVGQAVGTMGRYVIIAVGTLVILRSGGFDLGSLAVLAGAFSLGVGFGLQTIIHNFVSGLIILMERPIKEGDRIELHGVTGTVTRISIRSTLVVTNDNIDYVIPNSELISGVVINWTQSDRSVRFLLPVGVSYEADPQVVKRVLLEVADANPGVLKAPRPDVLFTGFGDSSMDFQLRVWTRDFTDRPGVLRSDLYFAIHHRFREEGIEIPFPQRVVHLRGPRAAAPTDPV